MAGDELRTTMQLDAQPTLDELRRVVDTARKLATEAAPAAAQMAKQLGASEKASKAVAEQMGRTAAVIEKNLLKQALEPYVAQQRLAQESSKLLRDSVRGTGEAVANSAESWKKLVAQLKGYYQQAVSVAKKVGALGAAFYRFAKRGAQIGAVQQSFEKLGGSVSTLLAMREALGGIVAKSRLVELANVAKTLGATTQNLPRFLRIAKGAASALGTEASKMTEDMLRGVARRSPLILDNLGLKLQDIQRLLAAAYTRMGTSAQEASEEEQQRAFESAVLTRGAALEAIGAMDSQAEGYARLEAGVENFVDSLRVTASEAVTSSGVLEKMTTVLQASEEWWRRNADAVVGATTATGDLIVALVEGSTTLAGIKAGAGGAAGAVEGLADTIGGWYEWWTSSDATQIALNQYEEITAAYDAQWVSVTRLESATKSLGQVTAEGVYGWTLTDEEKAAVVAISASLEAVSEKGKAAAAGFARLEQVWSALAVGNTQMLSDLDATGREIEQALTKHGEGLVASYRWIDEFSAKGLAAQYKTVDALEELESQLISNVWAAGELSSEWKKLTSGWFTVIDAAKGVFDAEEAKRKPIRRTTKALKEQLSLYERILKVGLASKTVDLLGKVRGTAWQQGPVARLFAPREKIRGRETESPRASLLAPLMGIPDLATEGLDTVVAAIQRVNAAVEEATATFRHFGKVVQDSLGHRLVDALTVGLAGTAGFVELTRQFFSGLFADLAAGFQQWALAEAAFMSGQWWLAIGAAIALKAAGAMIGNVDRSSGYSAPAGGGAAPVSRSRDRESERQESRTVIVQLDLRGYPIPDATAKQLFDALEREKLLRGMAA